MKKSEASPSRMARTVSKSTKKSKIQEWLTPFKSVRRVPSLKCLGASDEEAYMHFLEALCKDDIEFVKLFLETMNDA